MKEYFEEYKYIILFLLSAFTLGIFIYFGYTVYYRVHRAHNFRMNELSLVDIGVDLPSTHYIPNHSYFYNFNTASLPEDWQYYETFDAEEEQQRLQAYIDEHAMFNEETANFSQEYLISNANQQLYDLADKYYTVYYGSVRVSPIYPLAVANVETGGRADHNITWSALFPSKIVDIQNLYTMDVRTVLSDESIYKSLSTESSTRDRGALQMSPTYGTNSDYFNSLMSGTEHDKLQGISSNHTAWISGASTKPGDRFYVPDVCLRLSAANTDAIERMTENSYVPETDMQLVCMLAMYHHRSGVWSNKDHSKKIGEWYSADKAYQYSKIISSQGFVNKLEEYAKQHEDKFWIDADAVKALFKDYSNTSMTDYASNTLVCTYPIKVEYAYIKLCIMYSK